MPYGSVKVDSIVTSTQTVTVDTLAATATGALPKSGGTMTGAITFAAGQTLSGYAALATAQTFTAAQRGTITTLTDGATITPDFSLSNHYTVTLGGNRTLANPTNQTAGQSGVIFIVQDATGSRTLSYGNAFDFPSGTAPTLTTTANAIDALVYVVRASGFIVANLIKDVK